MPRIGQAGRRLIAGSGWTVLGALAGLVSVALLWGFTVDDALISVRYARHLAQGLGWRFNPHGAATDGVTPLPWPLLLAPFAGSDALIVLGRARALGCVASIATASALGRSLGRLTKAPRVLRVAILAVYVLSVPVAAYAACGMETPACALLATLAALRIERPWTVACLAGAAATLRPELAPWSIVLAGGSALASGRGAARAAATSLAAAGPFLACAVIRLLAFGHAAPLAVMAKPSDLTHGVAYAGAAAVVSVAPVLIVAPRALRRSPRALVLVLAAVAHLGAIAVVGGDWMPFGRLIAPIVPSLCFAAGLLGEAERPVVAGVRAAAGLALGMALQVAFGRVVADGRRVSVDRAALIQAARPILGATRRVAALDVGWVGAATEADIVDLAGLTDPQIAALPGGHTSKRVGVMMLLEREPDALVLYAPGGLGDRGLPGWEGVRYGRVVEERLAHDPVLARHFVPAAWLPLGGGGYVVLRAVGDEGGAGASAPESATAPATAPAPAPAPARVAP